MCLIPRIIYKSSDMFSYILFIYIDIIHIYTYMFFGVIIHICVNAFCCKHVQTSQISAVCLGLGHVFFLQAFRCLIRLIQLIPKGYG